MTILNQERVRLLLVDVGFRPREARIGSAVALCEAGAVLDGEPAADFSLVGDIELANDVWGPSYGGFQVRSLRAQKGTGGWRDEDMLLNPRFNCRAAKAIKRSAGWAAWSTFTTGEYRAYLQDLYPPAPGTYIVIGGDTLSTIAADHSRGAWDWTDLARVNGLHAPYLIRPGDTLILPSFP